MKGSGSGAGCLAHMPKVNSRSIKGHGVLKDLFFKRDLEPVFSPALIRGSQGMFLFF